MVLSSTGRMMAFPAASSASHGAGWSRAEGRGNGPSAVSLADRLTTSGGSAAPVSAALTSGVT